MLFIENIHCGVYSNYMLQEEKDQTMFDDLKGVSPHINPHQEHYSFKPKDLRSLIARSIVRIIARTADFFFKERYGHRAIVLETIASVPGIIGALFHHLKSLRLIKNDHGWIQTLLDEAENERMHLLVYSSMVHPTKLERFFIIVAQFFFAVLYFFIYLISPRTAHRIVGYFEEEAVHSYEHYLQLVLDGVHENILAPALAISYWSLQGDARLTDVIRATIQDEMIHRDVNHEFANDKIGTNLWW